MRAAVRFAAMVFAGLVLIQAAWIITLPPFRGIDEFDHVFRAAGVAEGQWKLSVGAVEGRGLLVAVPADVVQAASAQCDARTYTGPDNCFPVEALPGGLVTISTAAGAYHPGYYAVTGAVGQFFAGAGVDYSMRISSALLSSIGVTIAAFCLVLGGGGRWSRFGFLATLTPVFVYTSMLPAPNSMEIVAGLCLWTALLGLLREPPGLRHGTLFLLIATIAACVMATVRTIGPLWLALIVLTAAAWAGVSNVRAALARNRWASGIATTIVVAAVAASAWWTLSADIVGPSPDRAELGEDIEVKLGTQPIVWLLQIIAAFPQRADAAPAAVYVAALLVMLALFAVGVRCAQGRRRLVILAMALVIACLPVALTLATVDNQGVIWQGRYGLPYAAGLTLLCGAALDHAHFAPREGPRMRVVGCLVLATAHVISLVHVLGVVLNESVSVADGAWLQPHAVLIAVLTAAGWLLWALALRGYTPEVEDQTDMATPAADGARV